MSQSKRKQIGPHTILLLVEDAGEQLEYSAALASAGASVYPCANRDDFGRAIAAGGAAAVLDWNSLGSGSEERVESLRNAGDRRRDLHLLVLTSGFGFEGRPLGAALDCANLDILQRPVAAQSLVTVVRLALRAHGLDLTGGRAADTRPPGDRDEQDGHLESAAPAHERPATVRLLRDVATASNFADSVETALSFALAQVCAHTGWGFGHAFLPSNGDGVLTPVNAAYEHTPGRFRAFRAETNRSSVAAGQGVAGRVFMSGRPEWTHALGDNLDARRARLADQLGFATMAAFPILVRSNVVGVLEFFSEDVADPGPELLETMASIGMQLGRVIERDRLNRALRESVEFIEQIGDVSPIMIRLLDVERNRYLFVNRRMARFFGPGFEDPTRTSFDQFVAAVHPSDAERVRAAMREVRASGSDSPVTWQVRIRNADGEWRWMRTWSVLFGPGAQPGTQLLSVSIDVTGEVEKDEKLRQTERLTAIGTLAAGIAHEINNPLASVVMAAQLLRRQGLGPRPDRMLDDIIHDAKRCARIVRGVQRFAQQEPSELRRLNLNGVVRAAEELSRSDRKRFGVRARLELDPDLPDVRGDPTELEQVVLNLLMNASHASEAGREFVVRSRADDHSVVLTVEDRGHGMPPDVVRRAFEPFFTTRGRSGGTGLGLSIAHGIIEEHGGAIEIDSEVGRGTNVRVILPAALDPEPEESLGPRPALRTDPQEAGREALDAHSRD